MNRDTTPSAWTCFPLLRLVHLGALLLFAATTWAPAQMQPFAPYKGEYCPVVGWKDETPIVLKDDDKHRATDDMVVRPASSFGPGFVTESNLVFDYHPVNKTGLLASKQAIIFHFEGDVTADTPLEDCIALLLCVTDGSVSINAIPVGSLAPGKPRHLKLDLFNRVDDVGFLHVFSRGQEIRSTQVPQPYEAAGYLATLAKKSKGVPALDLCRAAQVFPYVLSDDGHLLATVRDRESSFAIVVYDLVGMKQVAEVNAAKYDEPISDLRWISSTELAYRAGTILKLLDTGTKTSRKLREPVYRILGAVRSRPGELVLHEGELVERFDAHSGKASHTTQFPDGGLFYIDDFGDLLLRIVFDDDHMSYQYRPTENSPWRNLDDAVKQAGLKFDRTGAEVLDRVADIHSLGRDGDTLYISTRASSDRFEIAEFSLKEGVIKRTIAKHPEYDLTTSDFGHSRLLFRKGSSELIGLIYEAEKPAVVWLDPHSEAVQKAIDHTLPDHINLPIDWSRDGSTFIFGSFNDQDPGTIYIFQPAEGKLIPLVDTGARLKERKLARTTALDFAARDGAKVHAYLTLPPDLAPGAKPPLVVNIHGGPTVRDNWGFDPTNQFLATRGYAVLQVNYRGSSGFGATYQRAGLRARLDTVVIDDVADGARHLVREGVVDPDRIVVMGGSFGGWATYLSLIKYPDLYKAGVAIAAISSWKDFVHSKHLFRDLGMEYSYLRNLLSGANAPSEWKYIDPCLRVAELKQPIYIMHGNWDWTVPPQQAELMIAALGKNNPKVKSMGFEGATHTYWPVAAQVIMLNEINAFFRQNLPARQ
ncbi:MAG TPA: prolyl oligopeptidase family serine peptidase [Candidatus Didemnitutus sp.]|nr:prolyl oligopeptidase family serine peptidase [Candidatus Didemnitutus sp.]